MKLSVTHNFTRPDVSTSHLRSCSIVITYEIDDVAAEVNAGVPFLCVDFAHTLHARFDRQISLFSTDQPAAISPSPSTAATAAAKSKREKP